jgi:hypothetical protein
MSRFTRQSHLHRRISRQCQTRLQDFTDETWDLALFNRAPRAISVPATLVPHLRSGLTAELGSAIDLLEVTLEMDEVDAERWRIGLAQFDSARELLDMVGVSSGSDDFDLNLDLTPRLARLLLDALRAVYDMEVHRLANAASDHVQLPLREIPALRNFILEAERRLGKTATRLAPLLDASEKRTPRTVKSR